MIRVARGDSWSGHIDDLRIYGRALQTEEIVELYNPPEPGFAHWISTHPNPPATNLCGPHDDSDGDSLSNAFEYVYGSDPNDFHDAPVPQLKWGGDGRVNFTVSRRLNVLGWMMSIETSVDLSTWETLAIAEPGLAATGLGLVSETGGEQSSIEVYADQEGGESLPRYYRVKVESPIDTP